MYLSDVFSVFCCIMAGIILLVGATSLDKAEVMGISPYLLSCIGLAGLVLFLFMATRSGVEKLSQDKRMNRFGGSSLGERGHRPSEAALLGYDPRTCDVKKNPNVDD